jgi:structural maintenance of chromosome 1
MAVTERQQLETLRREKKTLTDALASVQDKIQQASSKQTQLRSEIERLSEREEEVSLYNVSKYIANG